MKEEQTKENNYKSNVKAIGIKSIFANNGDIVITSFGKGNKANIEYDGKEINSENYLFDIKDKDIDIIKDTDNGDKSINLAFANNPTYTSDLTTRVIGQDLLKAKPMLEKKYFDNEYPNDNIRIQIIHNIQDIKKIVAPYISNITYMFKNLQRYDVDDLDDTQSSAIDNKKIANLNKKEIDLIGGLNQNHLLIDYDGILTHPKYGNPQIADAIKRVNKYSCLILPNKKVEVPRDIRDKDKREEFVEHAQLTRLYNFVRLMSVVRNWCIHDDLGKKDNEKMYNLDMDVLREQHSLRDLLNELSDNAVNEVNKNFVENNNKNLKILASKSIENIDINDKEALEKLALDYYNFAIKNENKNIGVNVKKIREEIISKQESCTDVLKDEYNTYRGKIYTLIDYVIYKYFINSIKGNSLLNEMVENLRGNSTEKGKEELYTKYAQKIYDSIGQRINSVIDEVSTFIKSLKNSNTTKEDSILDDNFLAKLNEQTKIQSSFVKVINLMCFLLDGKEVNELLTSLINKFDNISSLINVAKQVDNTFAFNQKYKIFDNADAITNELMLIKSIGRKKGEINIKGGRIYQDALLSLGIITSDNIYMLDSEGKRVKDEQGKNVYTEKYAEINDKLFNQVKNNKSDHTIRNFLLNNYIKSDRFIYILKYTDATHIREIMSNKEIIKFVLNRMDEKQIDRYYLSCIGSDKLTLVQKVEKLADKLQKGADITAISEVDKNGKETNKAILGLYLTVAYIFVKNMVKINTRYIIAWACHERDSNLFKKDKGYIDLTNYFIEEKRYNKHQMAYLTENLQELISINKYNDLLKIYRNNCVHLKVITYMYKFIKEVKNITSYYDIYQYCAEKTLLNLKATKDIVNSSKYLIDCKNNLNKYNTYNKNLVKVLNMPFAYNLPRYKQLSIDGLFNSQDNLRINKKSNSIID